MAEPLKKVGYWIETTDQPRTDGLLWPGDLIDLTWRSEEKAMVCLHLTMAPIYNRFRGMSRCRLCRGVRWNGSADQSDGVYVWPEGFVHYLTEHGVKPPQDFINHVLKRFSEAARSVNPLMGDTKIDVQMEEKSDAEYLLDLIKRLRQVPYDIDKYDIDRLQSISQTLEARKVKEL